MRPVRSLYILLLVLLTSSCGRENSVLAEYRSLAKDLKTKSLDCSEEEWDIILSRYRRIEKRIEQRQLSAKEKKELYKLRAQCVNLLNNLVHSKIEQIGVEDKNQISNESVYAKSREKISPESVEVQQIEFHNGNEFFGDLLPRKKKRDTLVKRSSYTLSYNSTTKAANWVAWHLTEEHTDGPFKRKGISYMEDEDIDGPKLEDWRDISDYDHGHLCPAGDNKWDRKAMTETFYLSNMCVQNSRLNQETWERLESTCREWARKFGDIYIVAGPIFNSGKIRKIGANKKLCVPDAFYKVVLCMNGTPKALGFIYNNENPEEHPSLDNHVVSVDEVEQITGIDFFYELPDSIEISIEKESDLKKWKVY
ncbi:MAG: DNA/RNA non-specific endonuclease [Bacteroidales bacterium]|nr:DNA/RNA non-specific endonuclease [Candidatus Minthousia equi]